MIAGVLQVNSKTIYGLTSRNIPIYRFKPLNTKLPDYVVGCSLKDKSKNVLALVQPSDSQRANLIKIIGECGDLDAEKKALFLQYSKLTWKKFDLRSLKEPVDQNRRLVKGYTFNIDPFGCQDIDDIITFGNDGYIYITIADVASWMVSNPEIFKNAALIGQTLYENGKVVSPMLPIQPECSLIPTFEKLGISLKFKWDGKQITDTSFEKIRVTNNLSLTYEEAQTCSMAPILKEIASYLAGKEVTDSHEWVEQFMIFYNCEAAKVLSNKKEGLLRTQDAPEIEKLETYKNFVNDLSYLANKSAKYVHASCNARHWGLTKDLYCHATSPIRRFADIVNQMVLCGYEIPEYDIELLNTLQSEAKKYERDLFFLEKLLETESRCVSSITLNDHRVWVPEWKRIVTCKNNYTPGTPGNLKYSLDMNQVSWKRRMVFKFEDTNCLE